MEVSVEFLIAPDDSCHRIAVLHTTKDELKAHQTQLEDLGIPSLLYQCSDKEFDGVFITSLGDFFVQYGKDKK